MEILSCFGHIQATQRTLASLNGSLGGHNMTINSLLVAFILCAGLAGCNARQATLEDGLALSLVKLDGRAPIARSELAEARFSITSFTVIIPETLQVSEANQYFPKADIVWRGELPGNRPAQVKAILEDGLTVGSADLKQGPMAGLTLQLERFHALTEKARFSVGGIHNLVFVLTVKDAKTGAVLEGPRRVELDIIASGGEDAIAQDVAGRTQRVIIVEGLAEAIRREFSGPLSLAPPPKRGLFAGFN